MFGFTQSRVSGLIFGLLLGILGGSAFSMQTGQKRAGLSESLAHPHDLAQKLKDHKLCLYYVEERMGSTDYLTADPRPIEELLMLGNYPNLSGQWRGTVRICRNSQGITTYTADWGAFGFEVGDYVVFGDPALVHKIKEVLGKD
jgi:hypothetical protein